MKEYKSGDTIWWARCGTKEIHPTCPICFGKRQVTLILGNDDHVITPCDYCGRGYEGPKGYIIEWEWVAEYEKTKISGVSIQERDGVRKIDYRIGSGYVAYPEDVFDTENEAKLRTEERVKEHNEELEKKLLQSKEYAHKTYSWHVGYHNFQLKEAQRKIEYHLARAINCKKLAKEDKKSN